MNGLIYRLMGKESHESVYVPGATYQEIRDEYLPRIDKGRIRRQMTFRKFYCLIQTRKDHKLDMRRNRIKAGVIAKDLEARVMKSEKNVETLLAEGRYDVLNELLRIITRHSSVWNLSAVRIIRGSVRFITPH